MLFGIGEVHSICMYSYVASWNNVDYVGRLILSFRFFYCASEEYSMILCVYVFCSGQLLLSLGSI